MGGMGLGGPRKGGKGGPRGQGDEAEGSPGGAAPGPDGGPRPSAGAQMRPPMPGGKGMTQGVGGMPMAGMAPFGAYGMPYAPYGAAVPYGGMPGGMPTMYAMPYYVMQPPSPMGGQGGMAPGGGPPQPGSPMHPGMDRGALKTKVQEQIEYYFGQENLIKDTWLRSPAQMNNEGYVPIQLLANFRAVTNLTNDTNLVMESIKSSTKLEIDTTGQMVRAKDWEGPLGPLSRQVKPGEATAAATSQVRS